MRRTQKHFLVMAFEPAAPSLLVPSEKASIRTKRPCFLSSSLGATSRLSFSAAMTCLPFLSMNATFSCEAYPLSSST